MNKFKNNQALIVGLLLTGLSPLALAVQEGLDTQEAQKVVKIEVLGSHIIGSYTVAANPVSMITTEEMKFIGAVSTTDLVNLRGLGLSSTLVLINSKP
ncbi:MAG: hypothetical protein ACI9N3_002658 [Colwellia sp.]